jgi:hypothetical protein
MFTPEENAERKSKCFSSVWWPIEREPRVTRLDEEGNEVLVKHGRPIRYVELSRDEVFTLARFGRVECRGFGTVVI